MITYDTDQTFHFGLDFAGTLKKGDVIALHGELGAGKTTFVKGVVQKLCAIDPDQVQSPTFTLLNIYEGEIPIFHFDLYRLKNVDEFLKRGLSDYLFAEGICLIEWPEIIAPLLKSETKITLTHLEGGKRKIDVQTG